MIYLNVSTYALSMALCKMAIACVATKEGASKKKKKKKKKKNAARLWDVHLK